MIGARWVFVGGPFVWQRITPQLTVEALKHVASFWKDKFLPLHFKPDASARYGYDSRKKLTNPPKNPIGMIIRRRLDKDAFSLPMVWTGLSRTQALRPAILRPGKQSVRLTMMLPNYFWRPGPSLSGHQPGYMVRELTTITEAEVSELAAAAENFIAERLNANTEMMEIAVGDAPETRPWSTGSAA